MILKYNGPGNVVSVSFNPNRMNWVGDLIAMIESHLKDWSEWLKEPDDKRASNPGRSYLVWESVAANCRLLSQHAQIWELNIDPIHEFLDHDKTMRDPGAAKDKFVGFLGRFQETAE